MTRKKVLIPTRLESVAAEVLKASGRYEVHQEETKDLAKLAAAHADTHALIVRSEKVTREVIDALPALKIVVRAGAGYDTIDTRYARQRGVDVMNTPGANANAVAEEVVAMILADARHLIAADVSCRAGKWEKTRFMGRELTGKTVGIVGLGNIGRLVARRLSGFDCQLLAYDPVVSSERAREAGVERTDLETLFSRCDYVTLHLPENRDTRGMIGARLLGLLRDGATIVNCARAGILDEAALRAEKARRSLRFLNDVYEKDAEGPKSAADIADIMLPHLGASTLEANATAARRAAEQIMDLDEKGITSYIVNRDVPEGLDRNYGDLAYTLARLARCLAGGARCEPRSIETSFYGSLAPFGDWLVVPIVAGVWEDCNRHMDPNEARGFLSERGIAYTCRETDPRKGYGNSITVDLMAAVEEGQMRSVSLRGTVAESTLMVSRINEFNKLYFEPAGHTAFFLYEDRPGVIGAIGRLLAGADVNIEDMRNPHDAHTNRSLAILKVNRAIPEDVTRSIEREIRALAAFHISL
jgi:D-3-phosphoglycerate dehydrogenase